MNNTNTILLQLRNAMERQKEFISCYLVGSYAYGQYIDGISDLDLVIFVREGDINQLKDSINEISADNNIQIDVHYFTRRELFQQTFDLHVREIAWGAKISNKLLCGEDLLREFTLPPRDQLLKITYEKTIDHFEELANTNLVNMQIAIPGIDNYVQNFITLRDGKPSLKQMVIAISWIATCYLACDYSINIASKSQAIAEYRNRYVDGNEMYALLYDCKVRWKYTLPQNYDDFVTLSKHCNYVSTKYKELISDKDRFVINVKEK